MSDLYPVIEDIISLLNNKYGTDISAEQFNVTAYTPELDEDKKEFTKEDLDWLGKTMTSHSFSGGVPGLIKRMNGKFNEALKQSIIDASKKFGDLRGVAEFISDYDNLKNKLPKSKPGPGGLSRREDLRQPLEKIKSKLKKIKDTFEDIEDSFYDYTKDVIDLIAKYDRSPHRSPRFERELLSLFVDNSKFEDIDNPGLIKGWRKLDKPTAEAIKDLYEKLSHYSESVDISKEEAKMTPEQKAQIDEKLAPMEKELRKLTKKPAEVKDKEKEIKKELKEDKLKDRAEILKDNPISDKLKHNFDKLDEYFKKAKKGYEKDLGFGKEGSLHAYTYKLINTLKKYLDSNKWTSELYDIINETMGENIALWKKINKTRADELQKFSTALLDTVETENKGGADKGIEADIKGLANKEFPKLMGTAEGSKALKLYKDYKDRYEKEFESKMKKKKKNDMTRVKKKELPETEEEKTKREEKYEDSSTAHSNMMSKFLVDYAVSEILSGKKIKPEPLHKKLFKMDEIKAYNSIIKAVVKNRDKLPQKITDKDLEKLNLSESDKKLAENEEFLGLASRAMYWADKLTNEDKKISGDKLADEVLNKIKEENTPKKDKGDVKVDVPIKKRLEVNELGDPKHVAPQNKSELPNVTKSSINIVDNYKGTIFYKLERLANMSPDKLVKAELENIVQDIKQIL